MRPLSLPKKAQTLPWQTFLRTLMQDDATVLLGSLQTATGSGRTAL